MKPITLIDDVMADKAGFRSNQVEINGNWYVSKPCPYYGVLNLPLRIRAAYAVLTGKALAVQFAEDQMNTKGDRKRRTPPT